MNLKEGDIIQIKEDLGDRRNYEVSIGVICVTHEMIELAGKVAKITRIKENCVYYLDIDNNTWCWAEEMFTSLSNNIKKL